MSCPQVIDVIASVGPAVVEVVTPGPPGASSSGGANLSDDNPLSLATVADPGDSEEASRADHRHALPSAQQVGADPTGTAAAAVAGHLVAVGHITLQQAAAAAPVQSVALALPTGWSTQATNTEGSVTLSLGLPTGQTLLTAADKASWDAAAALAGTAVQPAALATGLAGKVDASDARLSDSRTPTAHKSSHTTGGSDALSAADVGADPAGTASSAIATHLAAASHPAGDLGNLSDYILASSNLLLPRAAGTYFPYLSSSIITNGGTGSNAFLLTTSAISSFSRPNMGRIDTGTTATGGAGLTNQTQASWTGVGGKLSLQAIRRFQTTIWFVTPTALSGGANTYRIFFGWLDAATYSQRNFIGVLINGSALTITSTMAGVESSTALGTVMANTDYKVTLIYDAVAATITANVNGQANVIHNIPFTPVALGMLGVFVVKETGTTSIAFFPSIPQFHAWLSC